MRRRGSRRVERIDSDADPHDARSDLEEDNSSSASAEESSNSGSIDEYDLDRYLAHERQEGLQLTSCLARLQGARFGECGRILRDAQHAKPLRVQPTTRKRKRARDANERKYRKKKTKALPSSVEVQSDLRRKRVLAEAQATNGMESGNEEERFRSTTRETSRSERRRVNKKRVRAEADGQNTSEEENASNNGTWPSSQLRDGNADYGDLWDEESLLTAPPRAGLCWEDIPIEDDDAAPPSAEHRTLLSGADDTFDIVFECDL